VSGAFLDFSTPSVPVSHAFLGFELQGYHYLCGKPIGRSVGQEGTTLWVYSLTVIQGTTWFNPTPTQVLKDLIKLERNSPQDQHCYLTWQIYKHRASWDFVWNLPKTTFQFPKSWCVTKLS
jgi:hypothetical protein